MTRFLTIPLLLLLTAWSSSQDLVSAFVVTPRSPLCVVTRVASNNDVVIRSSRRPLPPPASVIQKDVSNNDKASSSSSSKLQMTATPVVSAVKTAASTPLFRRMAVALGAALLVLSRKTLGGSLLWPGSRSDPALDEPLPPGSMGCPFLGSNILGGTKEYGPYVFFDRMTNKLKNPSVFKFYAFGSPMVSVQGVDNIKTVLKDEFDPNGVNTHFISKNFATVFGDESILYEKDKEKHGLLRRLVGSAMTPTAIAKAVPAIQEAANDQADRMLASKTIQMETVCNDFTLDVAWRQILGLDLTDDEIPIFHQRVKEWVNGMFNPLFALPFNFPGLKSTKAYKAREYLVSKVEEKLAELDRNGPDGSTLSGIYFATDENDSSRKLTHKQVIDNALILIVAGSETSASTLTVAMLALGLHPDVWQKMKQEQQGLREKYGDALTKTQLDTECPYLNAVIKETLRIRPIAGMEVRQTNKSLVLDGKQIPKNWMIYANVRSSHDYDPVTYKDDLSHMDMKLGFDPDRWLNDSTKPSVWMPFGDGARRCLGERLAMTEMKVFLATLARRLDFDLVGPTDKILWKKMSVMSKPMDGVEVAPRPISVTTA